MLKYKLKQNVIMTIVIIFYFCLIKKKTKISDSILWQTPLYQHKCQEGKMTNTNATKQFRFHSNSRQT